MLGCLLGLGVLAKTLPFHAQLQPEALATSRGASGAKPVHVSEMFEDVCDLGTDWPPCVRAPCVRAPCVRGLFSCRYFRAVGKKDPSPGPGP